MKFASQVYAKVSGSVGGLTYAHNRGGMYCRARAVPSNPRTAQQNAVRNGVSNLSSRWGAVLTAAQRTAWNAWAEQMDFVDALGQPIKFNGQQCYIKCNSYRTQSGLSVIDVAPSVYLLATLTAPVPTITAAGTTVSVAFTNSDTWATEVGGSLLVYASRPFSNSRTLPQGGFRYAGRINGAVSPPTSPQVVTLPFASGPSLSKQAFRFVAVRADGRPSGPFPVTGTV